MTAVVQYRSPHIWDLILTKLYLQVNLVWRLGYICFDLHLKLNFLRMINQSFPPPTKNPITLNTSRTHKHPQNIMAAVLIIRSLKFVSFHLWGPYLPGIQEHHKGGQCLLSVLDCVVRVAVKALAFLHLTSLLNHHPLTQGNDSQQMTIQKLYYRGTNFNIITAAFAEMIFFHSPGWIKNDSGCIRTVCSFCIRLH